MPKGNDRAVGERTPNGKKEREEILIEWQVHAARERPVTAVGVIAVLSVVTGIGWSWVHPLTGLLAGIILLRSVAEFLLPVTFRLTSAGVSLESFLTSRFVPWERLKRVTLLTVGVHLSPFEQPHLLDGVRGVILPCDENKDRVFALCREMIRGRKDARGRRHRRCASTKGMAKGCHNIEGEQKGC